MSDPLSPDPLSPDPDDQPPALPPMSHREASWHTHRAGQLAAPTAAESSAPARELAGVAVSDRQTVAGVEFAPMTSGALLAVQGAARLARESGSPLEGADEAAVLAFCLARSEAAFQLTEAGRLEDLVAASRRLIAPVPLTQLRELMVYCAEQIALATGNEAPKKP